MTDKPAPSSITVNEMIAGGQELAERIGGLVGQRLML